MKYHRRYKNLHPRTIRETKKLARANPWRRDDWVAVSQQWLDAVSEVYDIEAPGLAWSPGARAIHGGGAYVVGSNVILMSHFSLVTLAHEFRHAVDRQRAGKTTEDAARAWSLSLFATACPSRFMRARKAGTLKFV